MVGKDDVVEFIRENKEHFRKQLHIEKIGIFGSFARGDQKEGSDIDLVIELEENTPDIFSVKEELRRAFAKRFRLNVDIARVKYLKPYVKNVIVREVEYVE